MALGCGTTRITLPLLPPLLPAPSAPVFWTESFDERWPERWQEREVRGKTHYEAVLLEGRRCLKAQSRSGGSILLAAVRFNPRTHPWLSWQWRVDQLVEGEALERKGGSDAAARVYVFFETKGLPWQKRSLDYVWSASLPIGTTLKSAFSADSQIIVAESGTAHLGQWQRVARDLREDYRRGFGGEPPEVIAIGLMNDTDNTGGAALAYFGDLRVSRGQP